MRPCWDQASMGSLPHRQGSLQAGREELAEESQLREGGIVRPQAGVQRGQCPWNTATPGHWRHGTALQLLLDSRGCGCGSVGRAGFCRAPDPIRSELQAVPPLWKCETCIP